MFSIKEFSCGGGTKEPAPMKVRLEFFEHSLRNVHAPPLSDGYKSGNLCHCSATLPCPTLSTLPTPLLMKPTRRLVWKPKFTFFRARYLIVYFRRRSTTRTRSLLSATGNVWRPNRWLIPGAYRSFITVIRVVRRLPWTRGRLRSTFVVTVWRRIFRSDTPNKCLWLC